MREEKKAYSLNSGDSLYFSNSASHSDWEEGGRDPVMGRQSTMERPDSVRRVTPPTKTMENTSPADSPSHPPTTFSLHPPPFSPPLAAAPAAPSSPSPAFRVVEVVEGLVGRKVRLLGLLGACWGFWLDEVKEEGGRRKWVGDRRVNPGRKIR